MSKEGLRLPDYLAHIAQAIERINGYVAGMDKDAWLRSTLVQDAVIVFIVVSMTSRCSVRPSWRNCWC